MLILHSVSEGRSFEVVSPVKTALSILLGTEEEPGVFRVGQDRGWFDSQGNRISVLDVLALDVPNLDLHVSS